MIIKRHHISKYFLTDPPLPALVCEAQFMPRLQWLMPQVLKAMRQPAALTPLGKAPDAIIPALVLIIHFTSVLMIGKFISAMWT